MRFKGNRIEIRTGPGGMQATHIGTIDSEEVAGTYYADVFLNYNSPAQIHRFAFHTSIRKAKAWVKGELEKVS